MKKAIDNPTELIDFSDCEEDSLYDYGGSDRKSGIIYHNGHYMVKFAEKNSRQIDIASSYVNNTIAEYIGSHIFASVGLPVHETLLGVIHGELVVACRNFLQPGETLHEFSWYMRKHYNSDDIGKVPQI